LTKKQETFLNSYTAGTWSVNQTTGLVDIQGDFFPDHNGLKNFLGIEFGNVTGNFDCYGNQLQSLKGAPKEVNGDFICSRNQLQSLEGAPREVGGNFICSYNQLQSLEGAPQKIDGDFNCYWNNLQSLEGAPQKVDGSFECSRNKLQSLEGAPREVGGDFDCSYNQLQSLVGAPQEVDGKFNCSVNQLQSLEGAPKEINGGFRCDKFQLDPGEWNMDGWLEVLKNGSEEAKKLIITLPIFNPTYWNSKISQNPESTILELSEFWDDMTDDVRNSIRIPSDLRDDFDNLLELVRSGIM